MEKQVIWESGNLDYNVSNEGQKFVSKGKEGMIIVKEKIYPLGYRKPYLTGKVFGPFDTKEQAKTEIERLKKSLPYWDCITNYFMMEG